MELIYKLTVFLVFLTINTLHSMQYAASVFATRKHTAKENKLISGENDLEERGRRKSNLLISVYVVIIT